MRIAYVTETFPPEINGVALTAARAVGHLRGVGHELQLIRPRQRDETALRNEQEWRSASGPIPMYSDLRYGLARASTFRRLWSVPGTGFVPELVHAATPGPLAWAALGAARSLGITTSAEFRTNFHAYSKHYGLGWLEPVVLGYLRRLHAKADRNFVPTRALARELAAQGFEHLEVIGRGVDAALFSPRLRDDNLRREWGATDDAPVLLYVGRLAAEKNVWLALDAFQRLRLTQPKARMVVVGDGPLRARLQAAHPTAHFTGVQRGQALARHYASADIFVFPSLTDTFGNVTLEAMASGLAVVAYDTAAAAQHVQTGLSGWLAPARPGEAGWTDFLAASARAAESGAWLPDAPLRQLARQAALRADWPTVLRRFEQQLVYTAAGRFARRWEHAALA